MTSSPPRITLLTDFGTADGYVAAMRGVIASRSPAAIVDDASHEIPPGDAMAARIALSRYWGLYPPGSVHVVVVDPGVGGDRRAIAVKAADRYGLGPDTGVLEPLLERATEIHAITESGLFAQPVSRTFHGRDVFTPVAAYLAGGGLLERVGPRIDDPVRLPIEPAVLDGDAFVGCVIHVDRFGNLITNIRPAGELAFDIDVEGTRVGRWGGTYADVASGEVVGLIGSAGFVEISVRDGSASHELGLRPGARVRLTPRAPNA